jgi:hypothetical protein
MGPFFSSAEHVHAEIEAESVAVKRSASPSRVGMGFQQGDFMAGPGKEGRTGSPAYAGAENNDSSFHLDCVS